MSIKVDNEWLDVACIDKPQLVIWLELSINSLNIYPSTEQNVNVAAVQQHYDICHEGAVWHIVTEMT